MKKIIITTILIASSLLMFAQHDCQSKGDKYIDTVKHLKFNTEHMDFGTAYFGSKIIFSSTNVVSRPLNRRWSRFGLPFLDLFIANVDEDLQLKNIKPFKAVPKSKYNEGPICFNQDYDFLIYTINSYQITKTDTIIRLELYYSQKEGNKWSDATPLPFNNSEYSVGHATIAADNKTVFFASDMPDGFGGVDIYKTTFEDGNWSEPENLGKKINTSGDEMFPFVHPDGLLFFSSNGRSGSGGLDVYVSDINDLQNITKPMNMGQCINSPEDDFAFILNVEQESGYFSSNREGGEGLDDIYAFTLAQPIQLSKIISGIAYDKKDSSILANTQIALTDENGNNKGSFETDGTGKYEFVIYELDKNYELSGNKQNYLEDKKDIDVSGNDREIKADLILEKMPNFKLVCEITDKKDSEKKLANVEVVVTNNETGEKAEYTTSANGDFEIPVKNKKLDDKLDYSLSLKKEGYLDKTFTYTQTLDKEGNYQITGTMERSLVKIPDLKPIYFDYNKWNIRPDAATELDKIVKFMNDNPEIKLELGSHTDCRGSNIYNKRLSNKRAKSSADYIKKRITNPERITSKGYGESQLINKCDCKECSEEEHQKNRRTEFEIVK